MPLSVGWSRFLQVLGILVALGGLLGLWLSDDTPPAVRSAAELALTNPTGETFQASFVIAGRDINYTIPARNPVYNARGEIVSFRTPASGKTYSGRTDSIFYVNVIGNKLHLIAIPRDLWLDDRGMRINAALAREGPAGLQRAVSELLGLPVDYHVIINIDIFERIVDALGGVTLTIPNRMYYIDSAASLVIDFQPGEQHLDGAAAANFVRFRAGVGDDFGRIDNLKRLASALLQQVQALNVRLVTTLPELVDTYFDEVRTDVSASTLAQLLRRAPQFTIGTAVTLPTFERASPLYTLGTRPQEVEVFLADTFGGSGRSISTLPEASLLISNGTGAPWLGELYRDRLLALGVPEAAITVRNLPGLEGRSRVQTTTEHWPEATYFASLLGVERRQVHQVDAPWELRRNLELVLGEDSLALVEPTRWARVTASAEPDIQMITALD